MTRRVRVLLAAVLGLGLAVATAWYERVGRAPAEWSEEVCSYDPPRSCRDGVLKGGWPLPYLVDSPGVSRVGQLAFFEDHFLPWTFAADALIMSAVLLVLTGIQHPSAMSKP